MQNKKVVSILVFGIAAFAILASAAGVFTNGGGGRYEYQSIRKQTVAIYGKGLYEHMSADVAIQGIAQDYITLFVATPLLFFALFRDKRSTLKSRFFLAGVLKYFFVTYLFYMNMAMYNKMFPVYILLVSASFFGFILTLLDFDIDRLPRHFSDKTPVKFIGGFLVFLSSSIALLWLNLVIPPLISGSIIPKETEHYTTLVVQGFDLSILLPIGFISGVLLIKKNRYGYFMSTITLVFLSLLMTALVAKVIAMANAGVNVIPVIFIIPAFDLLAIVCAFLLFKNIKTV